VDGQANADTGVVEFGPAEGGGRVRGVAVRDPGEAGCRLAEDLVLDIGEGVIGFVAVSHVGGDALDFEAGKAAKVGGERNGLVDGQPKAMEAGIDLDVDAGGDAGLAGGEGDGIAEFAGVAGEGEPGADGLGGIGGKGVAEDEDGNGDAGLAEQVAFVWPHNGETVRASVFECGGERGSARAVGVGLDDGDQFGGAEECFERADVRLGGGEIDLHPGVQVAGGFGEGAVGGVRLCQVAGSFPRRGVGFDRRGRVNLASVSCWANANALGGCWPPLPRQ